MALEGREELRWGGREVEQQEWCSVVVIEPDLVERASESTAGGI